MWTEWRTEDPSKCKKQCCDAGGGFTHQIRNCTINKQHCDLDKCEHYGAIRQQVSCETACDCMSNAGRSLSSPGKMVQHFCETKFHCVSRHSWTLLGANFWCKHSQNHAVGLKRSRVIVINKHNVSVRPSLNL